MTKPVYIVATQRTPVTKAFKGGLATVRADDLLAHAIKSTLAQVPQLDLTQIQDAVIGCAMPEGEQGLNIARIAVLMAGLPQVVGGVTVNRFCASGLTAVAMAADRIRLGEADLMLAGGVESMSHVPMSGFRPSFNPSIFEDQSAIAFGMGITAENVAKRWNISRTAQDEFAVLSHQKASNALMNQHFNREISPFDVRLTAVNKTQNALDEKIVTISQDDGVRSDTSLEGLTKLKPAFSSVGSVTAGNSSQMSDGAAAVLLASEEALIKYNLTPLAEFMGFAVRGVDPAIMGIGPIAAIPALLSQPNIKHDNVTIDDLDWIELNEAFAAQALAVIQETGLNPEKINPLGGAIALGHPLGATGAVRTSTIVHGLQRTGGKYGLVSMCIGTGMGAAGLFKRV